MYASTRRLLGGLAAAVLLLGAGGLVHAATPSATPAQPPSGPTGNEMLSVQPSLISVSVRPGSTVTTQLTLRAAADLDVTTASRGLAQAGDGSFTSVAADRDSSPYSARSMITASPASLNVQPGDSIQVDVTIAVPGDVGEGTRYAILAITGFPEAPSGSSNVGFGVELGVSVVIQITDTAQVETGEITGIDIGDSLPGQPLPVTVSFSNTGTTHYGAIPNELVTTATLQDAAGALLASASTNGNQLSVVPSFTRDVPLSMDPSEAFIDGASYHLEVGVGLKDGSILDRKALDFTWSGGAVLGETAAPIETPQAGAAPSTDAPLIILAALLGAAAVVVLAWVLPRLRRRRMQAPGTPAE